MIKVNNGMSELWWSKGHMSIKLNGHMTDLCNRLREERKRLGLNQADFAALGGVKKDAQLNYESGARTPDAAYLAAVASAGVDVLYVLLGEAAVAAISSDEKELILGYRQLDIRGKAGVLGMVGGMNAPEETAKAIFHGDIGQVVHGDQTGPVSFSVGGKKNKNGNKE
jgi:transcriptional regulator with XRE-family HTH domain